MSADFTQCDNLDDEVLEEAWRLDAANHGYVTSGGWLQRYSATVALARKVQETMSKPDGRLLISMPPRHTKTTTAVQVCTQHYLDMNPHHRVGLISYSREAAARWGGYVRDYFADNPLAWSKLDPNRSASYDWGLLKEDDFKGEPGGMRCIGLLGGIASFGFHIIFVDDPYPNWDRALSKEYRDKWWDFLTGTLWHRQEPDCSVIVMHHRWVEDDLIGRIQSEHPDEWDVFCMPALIEDEDDQERDSLDREIGESCIPERFTPEKVRKLMRAMGTLKSSGLMRQKPVSVAGNIYRREWWRYWELASRLNGASRQPLPRRFDEVVLSLDCAFKDAKTSSYVCFQIWGRLGADRYLLDSSRDHMDINVTLRTFRYLCERWPMARKKLVEGAANGHAVIGLLQREISGIIEIVPAQYGSKLSRAVACSPEVESGNVYLPPPERYPWVVDFELECAAFTGGPSETNDQVDTMSQALNYWGKRTKGSHIERLLGSR